MAMMKCPECGAEISDTVQVCPHCDAVLPSSVSPRSFRARIQKLRVLVKPVLIVLFLIFCFRAIQNPYSKSMRNQPPETNAAPADSGHVESPATSGLTDDWEPTRLSIDRMVSVVRVTLKDVYENYEVSNDGDTITVNVWVDGVASNLMAARNGNSMYISLWSEVKQAMEQFNTNLLNTIRDMGPEDAHLIFNVLNDENRANVILTLYDATIIFDALYQ